MKKVIFTKNWVTRFYHLISVACKYIPQPTYISSVESQKGIMIFNNVPLRTRRALSLYRVYGNSALLVLKGTLFSSVNALLVLGRCHVGMRFIGQFLHKQKWHCVETFLFFSSSRSVIELDLTYCKITTPTLSYVNPFLVFSWLFSLLFFLSFFTFPSFLIFSSFPSFYLLFFHSFILSWVLSVLLSPFLSSYFHSVYSPPYSPICFPFYAPPPFIFLPPLSSGWIMAAFELWWFSSYFFLFLVNISPSSHFIYIHFFLFSHLLVNIFH